MVDMDTNKMINKWLQPVMKSEKIYGSPRDPWAVWESEVGESCEADRDLDWVGQLIRLFDKNFNFAWLSWLPLGVGCL